MIDQKTGVEYNIFDLGFDRFLTKVSDADGDLGLASIMKSTASSVVSLSSLSSGGVSQNIKMVDGYLQSKDFEAGVKGWRIDAEGNVEFVNGLFRGQLVGNTIYIPNATTPLFSVDATGNAKVNSLERNDFHWFTLFESIDGYAKSPADHIICNPSSVDLTTVATTDSETRLQKLQISSNSTFTWDKNRKFKTLIRAVSSTQVLTYLVTGNNVSGLNNTTRHLGFKIYSGAIYATVGNGTSETAVDTGVIYNANNYILLEVKYIAGVSAKFYVGGILKATITTNLPSGTSNAVNILDVLLTTLADVSKEVDICYYDFWQAN